MADWVQAAAAELARLENPHREKKRATIIALVDARLAGATEESVWRRKDTCNRSTYHLRWKKDPVFKDVLEKVHRAAQTWNDTRAVRALALASERLALASPAAAAMAISRLNSTDDSVVLRAAFGILDRAGTDTAIKSSTNLTVSDKLAADIAKIYGGSGEEHGD